MVKKRIPPARVANDDPGAKPAVSSDRLTHLVYDASLDNSLWPELIFELTEYMQTSQTETQNELTLEAAGIAEHFSRAFSISERIVSLQEKEQQLTSIIDALSVGIAMLDDDGKTILENSTAASIRNALALPNLSRTMPMVAAETGTEMTLANWVREANLTGKPKTLTVSANQNEKPVTGLLLPRQTAKDMGFPAKAAAVLITHKPTESDALRAFAADCLLTDRETALVKALRDTRDLRSAAEQMTISYESARTYLKRVFSKTGCVNQLDLFQRLSSSPSAFIKRRAAQTTDEHNVRRIWTLKDGRALEYFSLGPEDGKPILYFDALSGSSIDATGSPDRYLPALERMNVRLITVCRPGNFRSTMRWVTSLRDYAPDIEELIDGLGFDKVSGLSYSFGSGAGLAVVHELQHRFDRLVLSSPAFPEYRHPNWRELDMFHHLSYVIGRRWPNMLRKIIPFLVRSVIQNVDRYFDRQAARAECLTDLQFYKSDIVRRRTKELLEERTAITIDGMVEENVLNAQGWDFDVSKINVPISIFHGVLDNVCPLGCARLLASRLPNATLQELENSGHYHLFTQWSSLLEITAGLRTEIDTLPAELDVAHA